jgi:hypothetical protein
VDTPPTLKAYQMGNSLDERVKLLRQLCWDENNGVRAARMLHIARQVTRGCPARDLMCELRAIYQFTVENVRYTGDVAGVDTFSSPLRTLQMGGEDCFPMDTKLIVRSRMTGQYELITLEDLRMLWPVYEALSYNFGERRYEFQAIEGFVDKGEKDVLRARLSTGRDLIATADHKFWTLTGQRPSDFKCQPRSFGEYLEAQKLDAQKRFPQMRILQAAQIPTLDHVAADVDETYLAGIFAAEGYVSESHVCISQSKLDIRAKIESALQACGVSARQQPDRVGRTGGAYYDLRACELKDRLREQGTNSFNMTLPPELLSANRKIIETLIGAYGDDDAYHPKAESRWARKVSAIYATSSDALAEQLQLGMLLLGRSFYMQHQLHHGGVGKKPIWRIYEQISPGLLRRESAIQEKLPGLRFGYVYDVAPAGKANVGCITVANNHNFFLADGTLVSNCDGHAVLNCALALLNGFKAKVRITSNRGVTWDHIYCLAGLPKGRSDRWIALDTTLARGRKDFSRFAIEPPRAKFQDFPMDMP